MRWGVKFGCPSDVPPEVVTEAQQRRTSICVNGKAGGAERGRVSLMVFTVWELDTSFTPQSNIIGPDNSKEVTGIVFGNLWERKYHGYKWRSVCYPVCPTNCLSHICLKKQCLSPTNNFNSPSVSLLLYCVVVQCVTKESTPLTFLQIFYYFFSWEKKYCPLKITQHTAINVWTAPRKVSTQWKCLIGPKCQYFVWPLIIFQHCLNPLGHGVYQIFTGCHWNPLPLLQNNIMELVVSSAHRTWFQWSMSSDYLSSANCLQAFSCIIFRRGFLLGWQPCRQIWCSVWCMVWALTDWPPHRFNLCSNAGSTHTSIFHRQPLDMMLSMCTQLLCSTMARHVLSETCAVKLLYGLGHRAAAQFLDGGSLLIAEAIFMWSTNSFFHILRIFYHEVPCWPSTGQYERVWEQ